MQATMTVDHSRSAIVAFNTAPQAVRRDAIVAKVCAVLDSSLPVEVALAEVARLALPFLGQWCAIDALDAAGQKRIAAVPVAEPPSMHVVRVPMRSHGRTLGTLSFATPPAAPSHEWSSLALATQIAQHCASALAYAHMQARADQAAHAHDEFVAATSHELRTPLSHIKGFVSSLRSADSAWDADTQADFLEEIEHEADRLAQLLDDLLDLSRLGAGADAARSRRVTPPAALIAAGADRVHHLLANHPLEVDIPDGVPPVSVVPRQIERVVANLLENAAKYSPNGAPISIVVGPASDGFLHVRVEDHGLGVPAEDAERIFEPFFREPNGAYPAKPGTGLGLAICRGIVRAHGGRIWVESRDGGGAAFVFSLPLDPSG